MKPRTDQKETRRDGFYRHPETGQPLVSVTTVLDQTIAKPALYYWNANMALEALSNNPDWLKLPEVEARRFVRSYITDYTDKAKNRGSRVHSMVEAVLGGADVTPVEGDDGYMEALKRWMSDRGVDVLSNEATVYHTKQRYAGTMDLLATYEGESAPFVVDMKTGSGLWPEYAYQVAAYAAAIEREDGIRVAGTEVVLLEPDGTYRPMMTSRAEAKQNYRVFLGAKTIWEDRNRKKLEKIGYWEGGDTT